MNEQVERFLAHFGRRNEPNNQSNELEALLAELRSAPLDRVTVVELTTRIAQAPDIGPAVAALFVQSAASLTVIGEQGAPFEVPSETRILALNRLRRTQGTADLHWILLAVIEASETVGRRRVSRAVIDLLEDLSWRNCGDETHLMIVAYARSVVLGHQRSDRLTRRMERYVREPKAVERLLLDPRFRALVPNSPSALRGLLVRISSEPLRFVIDRAYRELWERTNIQSCPA